MAYLTIIKCDRCPKTIETLDHEVNKKTSVDLEIKVFASETIQFMHLCESCKKTTNDLIKRIVANGRERKKKKVTAEEVAKKCIEKAEQMSILPTPMAPS